MTPASGVCRYTIQSHPLAAQPRTDKADDIAPLLGTGAKHRHEDRLRFCARLGSVAAPNLSVDHGWPDRLLTTPVGCIDSRIVEKGVNIVLVPGQMACEPLIGRIGLGPDFGKGCGLPLGLLSVPACDGTAYCWMDCRWGPGIDVGCLFASHGEETTDPCGPRLRRQCLQPPLAFDGRATHGAIRGKGRSPRATGAWNSVNIYLFTWYVSVCFSVKIIITYCSLSPSDHLYQLSSKNEALLPTGPSILLIISR